MKITLKPDTKPVEHRPYKLNLQVKEKVMKEIDKVLVVGRILLVDEVEWISPIVIQDKKDSGKIQVCVHYRSLNNECVYDPFPIAFSNEVFDNVGGNEAHSLTDGFLGYHHVHIAKEDKKTTLTTEWGSYAYNFMPFVLKNSRVVF